MAKCAVPNEQRLPACGSNLIRRSAKPKKFPRGFCPLRRCHVLIAVLLDAFMGRRLALLASERRGDTCDAGDEQYLTNRVAHSVSPFR